MRFACNVLFDTVFKGPREHAKEFLGTWVFEMSIVWAHLFQVLGRLCSRCVFSWFELAAMALAGPALEEEPKRWKSVRI